MALNFSHRPIFPASHMSEDNLVSPMMAVNGYIGEGIQEMNWGEGFGRTRCFNRGEVDKCLDCGRERVGVDGCSSSESVSKDIIDLLPSDPFGMDIRTTFTAITGWIEDFKMDYGVYGRNYVGGSNGDYGLFARLNLIWNNALRFQSFPGNTQFNEKYNTVPEMDPFIEENDLGDALVQSGFGLVHKAEDIVDFDNGNTRALCQHVEHCSEGEECYSNNDGRAPHDALVFALSYLGVRDLLSVEMVCRSLRSTVRSDPLLWRSIHIDQPLNEKFTDDVLVQLSSRAQGNLQCLSLVECPRITDDGLKRVLDANLRLTKLCVPGCTRLSIEGIVNSVKTFQSNKAIPGIKHLRIGGLYGVTHGHFEELKFLLGSDCQMQQNGYRPHFYHLGNLYLLCDGDRAIDIETCPLCQKLRLVYDCPADGCQAKDHAKQVCRACTLCIPRCVQCGRCINDTEYEETFCLELLCAECLKQLINCEEKQDTKVGSTTDAVHHELCYKFSLHG